MSVSKSRDMDLIAWCRERPNNVAFGGADWSCAIVAANPKMGDEDCDVQKSSMENQTKCDPMAVENQKHEEVADSQESGIDLSNVQYVYRDDVVRCNKDDGLIGIVTEVAGELDSDSSISDDEEEDDDDNGDAHGGGHGEVDVDGNNAIDDNDGDTDKNDALEDGQVRVTWLNRSETVHNLSDISVVDRGFLHGDIVASASDPTGQVGVVVDVNISVDLQTADGEVIEGVSSRHLQRIRDFTIGDYVVFGHWLGRVDDVLDNVTVLFDDGSTCKMMRADPSQLRPVSKNFLEDAHFPYYPGQRVRGSSSSVFKNTRWLSGAWKANRLEGTVIKVEVGSIFVYWVTAASPSYGSGEASVPSEEQKPRNLTLLSCFAHANWQLGDWCLLPPSPPVADEALSRDNLDNPRKSFESNSGREYLSSESKDSDNNSSKEVMRTNLNDPETFHNKTSETCNSKSQSDLEKSAKVCIGACNVGGNNKVVKSNPSSGSGSCSSSLTVSKEPTRESWPVHHKKICKVMVRRDRKTRKKGQTFEKALLIVNTMTKVDVAWQDGTREFGKDSKSLIPVNTPGDHEFCPEQYVVEKPSNESDDSSEVRRVGVVKSVNAKERTACVRWLKPVARPEDPREFDKEEVVSVYELDEHPDYDYCYGDIVVRLSPIPAAADASNINPTEDEEQHSPAKTNGDLENKELLESEMVKGSKDESEDKTLGLSWVGNITGLDNGDIKVTWANGMVSEVGPQAVYVVGRDDDEESLDAGNEVSEDDDDDAASWETVEENERDANENIEEEVDLQSATGNNSEMAKDISVDSEEDNSARSGALSIPLAALGFVTRLASLLFSRGRKQMDQVGDGNSDGACEPVPQITLENGTVDNECSCVESSAVDGPQVNTTCEIAGICEDLADNTNIEVESIENSIGEVADADADVVGGCYEDVSGSLKRFDIARDPVDNYYFGGSEQNINGGRRWAKKVQQDWSILEKNLPDGIYVRVYEDRMDLLRAVIVGAYGTPYQDGLFFFDFLLPLEYPQVPPSAYYHSGGLRLNPNLYEDGKVCLSLLNTWTGKGNEVWDPSSSSILQVLVSVQGLVLNSRPYFNEAGYDKQVGTAEGEKNSLLYNENTFLLNCKSMLYLLRRPPMHFEEFVKLHFQRRGNFILKACDAYMGGCLVGSLTKDACRGEKSGENSNSVGFKLMLAKIMPKLVTAFSDIGAES